MRGPDRTDIPRAAPHHADGAATARRDWRQVELPGARGMAERVACGHEREALRMREWYRDGLDRAFVDMMVPPAPAIGSSSPGAPPSAWPEAPIPGARGSELEEIRTWYRTWYETETQPGAAMNASSRLAGCAGPAQREVPVAPVPAVAAVPVPEPLTSPPPMSFLRRGGPAPILGGRTQAKPAGAR